MHLSFYYLLNRKQRTSMRSSCCMHLSFYHLLHPVHMERVTAVCTFHFTTSYTRSRYVLLSAVLYAPFILLPLTPPEGITMLYVPFILLPLTPNHYAVSDTPMLYAPFILLPLTPDMSKICPRYVQECLQAATCTLRFQSAHYCMHTNSFCCITHSCTLQL